MPERKKPDWIPDSREYRNGLVRELQDYLMAVILLQQEALGLPEGLIQRKGRRRTNYLEVGIGGFSGIIACPQDPGLLMKVILSSLLAIGTFYH